MTSITPDFNGSSAKADAPVGPHGETALHLAAKSGDAALAARAIAEGATAHVIDKLNNTPLQYAVMNGDAATIRVIARAARAGLNHAGHTGTALGIAAQGGDITAARELLDSGADIDQPDDMGATPLMSAVHAGHKQMVEFLIARGANVNALRAGEGVLHLAARRGDPDMIGYLLKNGAAAHIHSATGTAEQTPLHIAVLTEEIESARALLKAGALTTPVNKLGFTPLVFAVQKDNAKMVRLLVTEGGADMRTKSGEFAFTPLLHAAHDNKLAAAAELLRLGADPLALDDAGRDALAVAAKRGHDEMVSLLFAEAYPSQQAKVDALCLAAKQESQALARMMLETGMVNVNLKASDGETILYSAMAHFTRTLSSGLIAAGADVNARTAKGDTPLLHAARRNHAYQAEQLLEKGALVDAEVDGETALHVAARNLSEQLIKELLKAGANPLLENRDGKTARKLADEAPAFNAVERAGRVLRLLEQAEKDYITKPEFPKNGAPQPSP